MNILKDKLILSIILISMLLIYIMATRGEWTTRLIQENAKSENKYRLSLSKNLAIESEHFINTDNQTIGSATYIVPKNCFRIDSLSIKFYEVKSGTEIELINTKTQFADINQIEFNQNGSINEESLLKDVRIEICPRRERI